MRIHPFFYGVLVIVVFFGIILGFQAAGVWSVSGKVDSGGQTIQPSASDVDTIKGWMTLEQIATTYNVPMTELLAQFDLPEDTPPTTAIKDLESDTFDTTSLREWLQSRNQPIEVLPSEAAAPIPTQEITLTSDSPVSATVVATEHVSPEMKVTGNTTFQDLLDWGVPVEAIQKVIGADLPAPSTVIKDYITGKGLEFSTFKTQLQSEVDKIK
jgi:hypothetical protein